MFCLEMSPESLGQGNVAEMEGLVAADWRIEIREESPQITAYESSNVS